MRVLQYNILKGGADEKDPGRLSRLRLWVSSGGYDVLGLNELNGWVQPPGIHARAKSWGYSSAEVFFTTKSKYPVGVLAKSPIVVLDRLVDGFHHGVLHVLIQEVHYVIAHLTPVSAAARVLEADALVRLIRDVAAPTFIMGDMNTLSPLDREEHEVHDLKSALRASPKLAEKFLDRAKRINYEPMRRLLDAGLVDVCHARGHSVPTPGTEDIMHAAPMRLDYILANDAAMQFSPRARIVAESATSTLSDHYPVECLWD
jgi:endonuclease/exonuclease/phosphatase family metal-dependent hydrolase